jgi:hypothetical protein
VDSSNSNLKSDSNSNTTRLSFNTLRQHNTLINNNKINEMDTQDTAISSANNSSSNNMTIYRTLTQDTHETEDSLHSSLLKFENREMSRDKFKELLDLAGLGRLATFR